jgi:hypothetical protein
VRLNYVVHAPVSDGIFEVYIYPLPGGPSGTWCQLSTRGPGGEGIALELGPGTLEFDMTELGFLPGMYHISAAIAHSNQALGTAMDYQPQCLTVRVDSGKMARGSFYMPHQWRLLAPASAGSTESSTQVVAH